MKVEIITSCALETQKFGERIAPLFSCSSVITLNGDLGAGKTTFTQGFGKGMNVKEAINSPTFNILKCYFSGLVPLYHIDAYRLEDQINKDIGLDEVIQGDGICLIEWSHFIDEMIDDALNIEIYRMDENHRKFVLTAFTGKYTKVLTEIAKMYEVNI